MQICLCEPADISSSGQNVQAYFIYHLSHYIPCYRMFYKCTGAVMRVRAANVWHNNGGTICVTLFFINVD